MSEPTSEEDTPIRSERIEQSYLGNLLLSYEPEAEILNLAMESFSTVGNQLIFQACKTILKTEHSASPAAVTELLREQGALVTAGGEDYIYGLLEAANTESLTLDLNKTRETILKQHKLRMIASTANAALKAAFGAEGDLASAESKTRELLTLLETRRKRQDNVISALEGITTGAAETFRPAIKTGWSRLDSIVKMSPGRLIVLGARPGIGKTTLSVQLASQILCLNKDAHILYCSVEMDAAEIGLKSLSMLTSTDCVSPFQMDDSEKIKHVMSRAGDKASIINRLHVFYGTRMDKLANIANRISEKHNLQLVVCDFISSMKPTGDHGTRTEAIGSVSKALKSMAKEMRIPVLACSQLNRGANANKRPNMKDLRDSGEIEQDADIVMLLHRDSDTPHETDLYVEKNRFGILTEIKLEPQLSYHRFRLIDYATD